MKQYYGYDSTKILGTG